MKLGSWWLLLLASMFHMVSGCPSPCSCSSGIVDCSYSNLGDQSLPASFPSSTQVIRLDQNNLNSIPNGLLDRLPNLREVHLKHNPWHCDCNILYLRSWLQAQQKRSLYRNVICESPESLKGRVIMYLTEEELVTTCQYWYCNLALVSQLCLCIFIVVQGILLIFVIFSLRRFQRIAREARRTAKELQQNSEAYLYDNIPLCNYDST
ncbi:PREDICTED: platelet glycoprotein Ib beta chain [Nanorana parkeri]|uniref:platelet glycoprotein Ib beta chain n=1 Tax=Nanorana parkeri TaxID=125878 RepID=UPI000854AFDB|nr:PREDICTED: platelet glycoprotein Ib beta chain [Nanorana parkeri]XP_018412477.1 PREDICTED: platelet glycoprotein Ib beta chain [Nanorana parkeri]XP_018412478.1 PREDICTED: platelet glycoprotein Ib beta chain [Nanorana parkeri]